MASTTQADDKLTIAFTLHSATATTTEPLRSAASDELPEETVATFAELESPLLRLPGEIRNRICHEIFWPAFVELESQDTFEVCR